MEKQLFNNVMQGWQCPICKRIYSPFTHICWYCNREVETTTLSNTRGLPQEQKIDFVNNKIII